MKKSHNKGERGMYTNNQFNNKKSITLIGFMGAGKTTIGHLLAEKLNRPFIDTDEKIEEQFGMPPSEIFATYGEQNFRKKEQEIVLTYCKQPGQIISLGGGAFLQTEVRNACLKYSIVCYLDISWAVWKERLPLLIDSRPLLQEKTIEDIKELYLFRQSIYKDHHLRVMTDGLQPEEVVTKVIQQLKSL